MAIRAVAGGSRRNLLIIVAREPAPGMTKTRLGRTIGMERACLLYEAFLTDLAVRFAPHRVGRDFAVAWAYTPESLRFPAVLRELAGDDACDGLRFVAQSGADLTERQVHLLRWGADQGFARTVVMASDSPQIVPGQVRAAFAALGRAHVALGRVHDGGYYLIGVRGRHDPLTGVAMSTGNVADNVAARVRDLNLSLVELPCAFDVDVVEDLPLLIGALMHTPAGAPATWAALCRLGLNDGAGRRQPLPVAAPVVSAP